MRKLLLGKKIILENLDKDILSIHTIGHFPEIKKWAFEKKIPFIIHQDLHFFNSLNINHQGIVAFLRNLDFKTNNFNKWYEKVLNSNKKNKIVLLLDQIEDIGNFGAIIRTSDCFGVNGIIIRDSKQAPINEVVIKNSMGSIYNSNILVVKNLSETIEKLKKLNFWSVASTPRTQKNYYDISYNFNCILIIGNENKGISQKILSKADYQVKIPMEGSIESLNVSVATGVFLSFIQHNNNGA